MRDEVLSYAPDAYIDESKTKTGYEISFTKYFYKPVELREMSEILESIHNLEKEAGGVWAEVMEGLWRGFYEDLRKIQKFRRVVAWKNPGALENEKNKTYFFITSREGFS
ncbi:MAG: hypothetical protein IJ520_12300 [Synergistaceae bacterium]|nr:hypothetical protein [Synergistaceae bacterium]